MVLFNMQRYHNPILFYCVDFIESRNIHFTVNTFKELFEKIPPDSISSYLHLHLII